MQSRVEPRQRCLGHLGHLGQVLLLPLVETLGEHVILAQVLVIQDKLLPSSPLLDPLDHIAVVSVYAFHDLVLQLFVRDRVALGLGLWGVVILLVQHCVLEQQREGRFFRILLIRLVKICSGRGHLNLGRRWWNEAEPGWALERHIRGSLGLSRVNEFFVLKQVQVIRVLEV